ncbi:MAG: M28 family peptidase [Armatimonadetes bacterium]|nr:M28 family peptidase [Armatimonadota bacterium]
MSLQPGAEKTAKFLETQLKNAGLTPAGTRGYRYPFEMTVNSRPAGVNFLKISPNVGGKVFDLQVGKDYLPSVGSLDKTPVKAEMAFVGYGREMDYKGLDVKGKALLMFRGMPDGTRDSNPVKAERAASKGAVSVIFIGPDGKGAEITPITRRGGIGQAKIVAASMNRSSFKALVGKEFSNARETDNYQSKDLKMILNMQTESEPNKKMAENIIAVIPGTDPKLKDEIIVLGSHYDHLGYGEVGALDDTDGIHFGADDNASGTIANLALARYFAKTRTNRRTLMFQWYCGEEVGLLGSTAWVQAEKSTLPKIQAMINMDMVGRLRESLTTYCVNSAAEFPGLLDSIKVEGVKFNPVNSSPGNSDHAGFINSGVPSLFFFTGEHSEYHTEKDTFATLNLDGMARVIEVVRQAVIGIDKIDNRLAFTAKRESITQGGDPNRPRRVRVGFVPDETSDGNGLPLRGVSPGSPAERAGAKAGDILISLDGVAIRNVQDLQTALVKAKVGVKIIAVILRGGKQITLEVTPEAPPG